MKKWVCRICGYIHEGETPPDRCPVCRAPSTEFFLQDSRENTTKQTDKPAEAPSLILNNRLLSFLAAEFPLRQFHPITVHFPNGLIPVSVFFLLIAMLFDFRCVELTAFYLLCAATAVAPFAFATGIYNWKTKYKGVATVKFRFKVYGGIAFIILSSAAIAWRINNPDIVELSPVPYFITNLILLVLVTMLGHIGGGFVFARDSR